MGLASNATEGCNYMLINIMVHVVLPEYTTNLSSRSCLVKLKKYMDLVQMSTSYFSCNDGTKHLYGFIFSQLLLLSYVLKLTVIITKPELVFTAICLPN